MGNAKLFIIGAAGLALAGCLATGQSDPGSGAAPFIPSSEHPGTKVTLRNPDPYKWIVAQQPGQSPAANPQTAQSPAANPQAAQSANVKTMVWNCRPMACAGRAAVAIQMTPTPARHPDRKALEKAAKLLPTQTKAQDLVAEAASEGDVRITSLSSRVTELRGYPAIMAETKQTSHGKASYTVRSDIFMGSSLVKLISVSTDRLEAKRHFDIFLAAMEITDIENPNAAPPSQQSTPIALDNPASTAPVNPGRE